jgi:valyl-tRNA synthetase
VRDDKGRKMSKSLGNSIDPLTIIDEYSADALRYSLMMITATGQDVFLSNDKFEIGRNFGTKIWNAASYMQMQEKGEGAVTGSRPSALVPLLEPALLSADDLHILAKLSRATESCTENLTRFRFNDAAQDLYGFIWHEYCDWYVEYSKDVLYGQDPARRAEVLKVMHYAFSTALRLLHPFMPHLTEELWHGMGYGADDETIMTAPWPKPLTVELAQWGATPGRVEYVDARHEMIRAGRMLRTDCGIAPGQKIDYILKPNSAGLAAWLKADTATLKAMLKASEVTVDDAFTPNSAMPGTLTGIGTIYMPIEGLIDAKAESAKLTKQLEELGGHLERANQKLNNQAFISKAKPEVVAQFEKSRMELQEKYLKTKRLLEMLG